jgi:hypothetical protein
MQALSTRRSSFEFRGNANMHLCALEFIQIGTFSRTVYLRARIWGNGGGNWGCNCLLLHAVIGAIIAAAC